MYDQKIISYEHELIDLIKNEMASLVKLKAKETYKPTPLKTFHQQELEIKRSLLRV
ncbi:MAG: hypothetical protein HWD61_03190 [Parachlamydiaceae bacterium]|nr:MAG: hypothetical protein HWD61_03190 [Parachlamydiaceae bacterium]